MDLEGGSGGAVALLPAAGSSRRMGRPKLLLPYHGTTLLGSLVESLSRGGVERILLVVAPESRQSPESKCLRRWAAEQPPEPRLEVALNPRPERGMLSSIWTGLDALGGAERFAAELEAKRQALLVTPADLPALDPATVSRLLAALAGADRSLVLPTHRGKRGHPLVMAPRSVRRIPRLDPTRGLRQLLELEAERLLAVEVEDPGVLHDVDTPEDYRALVAEPLRSP